MKLFTTTTFLKGSFMKEKHYGEIMILTTSRNKEEKIVALLISNSKTNSKVMKKKLRMFWEFQTIHTPVVESFPRSVGNNVLFIHRTIQLKVIGYIEETDV